MTEASILASTLGLSHPWTITAVNFFDDEKRMEILVDYAHACAFCCPDCGCPAKVGDSTCEIWHHANFFDYSAYIHVRVPKLHCSGNCCGDRHPELPWTREGSRFVRL